VRFRGGFEFEALSRLADAEPVALANLTYLRCDAIDEVHLATANERCELVRGRLPRHLSHLQAPRDALQALLPDLRPRLLCLKGWLSGYLARQAARWKPFADTIPSMLTDVAISTAANPGRMPLARHDGTIEPFQDRLCLFDGIVALDQLSFTLVYSTFAAKPSSPDFSPPTELATDSIHIEVQLRLIDHLGTHNIQLDQPAFISVLSSFFMDATSSLAIFLSQFCSTGRVLESQNDALLSAYRLQVLSQLDFSAMSLPDQVCAILAHALIIPTHCSVLLKSVALSDLVEYCTQSFSLGLRALFKSLYCRNHLLLFDDSEWRYFSCLLSELLTSSPVEVHFCLLFCYLSYNPIQFVQIEGKIHELQKAVIIIESQVS
jgi:hypothetical protein